MATSWMGISFRKYGVWHRGLPVTMRFLRSHSPSQARWQLQLNGLASRFLGEESSQERELVVRPETHSVQNHPRRGGKKGRNGQLKQNSKACQLRNNVHLSTTIACFSLLAANFLCWTIILCHVHLTFANDGKLYGGFSFRKSLRLIIYNNIRP